MSYLHRAFFVAVTGLTSLAPAAFAETAAVRYDPVARAIALDLTPEAVDAAFDSALNAAESCDVIAVAMQIVGCMPNDFAASSPPVLRPAES